MSTHIEALETRVQGFLDLESYFEDYLPQLTERRESASLSAHPETTEDQNLEGANEQLPDIIGPFSSSESLSPELFQERLRILRRQKIDGNGGEVKENQYGLLSKVVAELWQSFSQSLLKGEFIQDEQYSERLSRIVGQIKNHLKDNQSLIYLIHPALLKLAQLCEELLAMCKLFSIQLKLGEYAAYKRVVFMGESHSTLYRYAGGAHSPEMEEAETFYDLGRRLIFLTKLDMCYIVNAQVVGELMAFASLCAELMATGEGSDKRPHFLSIDPGGGNLHSHILRAIRVKIGLLSYQALFKVKLGETKLIELNQSNTPFDSAKESLLLLGNNCYYCQSAEGVSTNEGNVLKQIIGSEWIGCLNGNLLDRGSCDEKGAHIELYDKYVEEAEKARNEDVLSANISALERVKELRLKKEKGNPPPLESWLSVAKRISEEIKGSSNKEGVSHSDKANLAKALGELIGDIQTELDLYREFTRPYQKRFRFSESFYLLQAESENSTGFAIFISSYGARPIHIEAVLRDKLPEYKRVYTGLLISIGQEVITQTEKFNKALKEAEGQMDKATEQMDKATEHMGKAEKRMRDAEEQMDVIVAKQNSFAGEMRKESMSLMAIFSAVVLFLGVGASVFKDADMRLGDYLVMFGSMYILIALLLSVLYFRKFEGDRVSPRVEQEALDQGQDKMGRWRLSGEGKLYCSLLVAAGLIGLGWYMRDSKAGEYAPANARYQDAVEPPDVNVVIGDRVSTQYAGEDEPQCKGRQEREELPARDPDKHSASK